MLTMFSLQDIRQPLHSSFTAFFPVWRFQLPSGHAESGSGTRICRSFPHLSAGVFDSFPPTFDLRSAALVYVSAGADCEEEQQRWGGENHLGGKRQWPPGKWSRCEKDTGRLSFMSICAVGPHFTSPAGAAPHRGEAVCLPASGAFQGGQWQSSEWHRPWTQHRLVKSPQWESHQVANPRQVAKLIPTVSRVPEPILTLHFTAFEIR